MGGGGGGGKKVIVCEAQVCIAACTHIHVATHCTVDLCTTVLHVPITASMCTQLLYKYSHKDVYVPSFMIRPSSLYLLFPPSSLLPPSSCLSPPSTYVYLPPLSFHLPTSQPQHWKKRTRLRAAAVTMKVEEQSVSLSLAHTRTRTQSNEHTHTRECMHILISTLYSLPPPCRVHAKAKTRLNEEGKYLSQFQFQFSQSLPVACLCELPKYC